MFEKEAEEYETRKHYRYEDNDYCGDITDGIIQSFIAGAEFGYNKANEWHYVKDGDLPEEDKSIMIYAKLADGVAVGKRRKQGKVYEWYFATYDGTFCLRDKEVIAWKEIVLPELKEIEENDKRRI